MMGMGMGVLVGLAILMGVVAIITMLLTKMNSQKIDEMKNVYLGKMINTDSSIHDAIKYVKLTNGIGIEAEGENK